MKIPKARKLSSGTWFIQLRLNGESISVTAETEKKCIAKAMAVKSGLAESKNPVKITLSQAIDKYIESRENTLSPSTIGGYRTIQRTRFLSSMDKPLASIKNWQAICNAEAQLCSPKTLKNAWGFINSVLKSSDITPPKITLPQIIKKERPFLSPEEIKFFLKAVEGKPCEIPALLELHSLRRSELLALTWENNIDLKNRYILVSGAVVVDKNNKLVHKETNKNVTSQRKIPIMIDRLYELLSAEENKEGYLYKKNANELYTNINRICKSNNLPEVGNHGLRHSFASLAYHIGMSEMTVMRIGGWSDYATVRKIYTHLAENDLESQTKAMSDFFNKNC